MAYLDNVYAVVQIAPTGIPTYVRLSQNENGRILHFAISGDALPAGSTVVLTGTKPDGAVYSVSGTLADNIATFNEDEQLTAVAGEWDAKVEVTKSGNLIATGRIKFVIDADPSGGNIPSDSQLDGYIAEMLSLLDAGKAEAYGSPLVASTVAGMTDQSRVYVYTGSETGYTAGNWYYWNGSAWTSGGVYNAVAVSTDTTLSIAGKAADAKATGEALDELKDDLSELEADIFQEGSSGYQHKTVTELFIDGSLTSAVVYPPGTSNMGIVTQDGWNSWYVEATEAMDIFFDSSLNIGTFIMGQISNVTEIQTSGSRDLNFIGTNPDRYRYTNSEGFPTEMDKLHVNANDTIMISLQTGVNPDNVLIYYGEESPTPSRSLLNENINLNESQINQVANSNLAVRFDVLQEKTEEEKARARENIGLSHKEELSFTYDYFIKTGTQDIGEIVDIDTLWPYWANKFTISDCKEGDIFLLTIKGGGQGRAWCFVTSDNRKISCSDANVVLNDELIMAPQYSSKIIICDVYRESEDDTTSTGGTAYKIVSNVEVETDTTLTKNGVPADAKTVGDTFASIGVTAIEPLKTDIPSLFITGTLPTSKDDGNVKVQVAYKSQTEEFTEYATLKVQGNSSTSYPKKNFTIKFFSDSNCTVKSNHEFMGWGNHNKYVLKANWSDVTQSRNVVTARLWTDVLRSRPDYASLPSALKTSPNYAVIDGFIVKVFANGVYQGRYTFNLPKDAYMFNMDDSVETNCVLYSENYDSGCYKSAAVVDGTDWTDEIHEDNPPQSVITRLNAFITFLNNSSDANFVSDLHNYVDVQSIVDYYLFGLVDAGFDSFGKNQILLSYDNCPFIASVYDLDCTWGIRYDGAYIYPANHPFSEYYGVKSGNVLYLRFPALFANSIRLRYSELRSGALSAANIIYRFEDFLRMQSKELVEEDYASTTANGAFVDMPSKNLTSLAQIRNYAAARLDYVDGVILV